MFQALEHKISLRENYFLPRCKLKFIENKIKKIFFYLYFSRLNRTFAHRYDAILKKISLFMRLAGGDMDALSDTYPRH
jgi:hypothetical protein